MGKTYEKHHLRFSKRLRKKQYQCLSGLGLIETRGPPSIFALYFKVIFLGDPKPKS